jgi:hypothetical protein
VRQATTDLKDLERLAHRVAHLWTIVGWADALLHDLGPLPAPPDQGRRRFEAALALAHRVLANQDAPDQGDQVRRVVDPDARCGTHGADCAGYLLDSSEAADSDLLTALNLLPGNGDAARDTQTRLEAEPRAPGNTVAAGSIDGRGWNGEVLRALSAPQGVGVEVYGPPPAPEETPFFPPAAFVLDAQRGVGLCPGGQQTATKERRANGSGGKFVFARRQGAGCARQARCLARLPQKKGRSVIKHDYQAEYDAVREWATTAPYAAVRQQHPRGDRKLADLVRYHDGRRCRSRGQWRVPVQSLLTGLVVHVKRRVKRLGPVRAPYALPVGVCSRRESPTREGARARRGP